jgi:hypothetical protein
MRCDKVKSLLGWYYDDELDAAYHKLVAEHLQHCPDCAGELAKLVQLDRISRQLVAPEPPPGVWDGLTRRLIAHESGQPARDRAAARRRFLLAAGGLAASLLAGTLTYRAIRRGNPGTTDGIIPPDHSGQPDPIAVNLALLSPDDRRLAESQRTCAGGGCDALLGACGCPIKLVLQGQPVFLCGKECEQWARAHPAQVLAKLHTLEHRHEETEKR